MLCLLSPQAITPLGWKVAASMDVAAKNLDSNDRYSYEGLSEDMHTWFFLYDEKVAAKLESEGLKQVRHGNECQVYRNQEVLFVL